MERFFRSLKSEWVPLAGYANFREAYHSIIQYITGYYSQLRPHWYNNGFAVSICRAFSFIIKGILVIER
ncbi:transposase OrfAB, subunit B [Xenorhabdus sp. PB62.4]|nr:transposase OrfAB, subunit B [Xenorhabdus sp. PB62.4]